MARARIQEECIGITLTATITDNAGDAIDLTGATLTFIIANPAGNTTTLSGTSATPTSGICTATTTSAEFDVYSSSNWSWQVKAYYSASQVYFTEVKNVLVEANL